MRRYRFLKFIIVEICCKSSRGIKCAGFNVVDTQVLVLRETLIPYVINQQHKISRSNENLSKTHSSNNSIPKLLVYGGLAFCLIVPVGIITIIRRRTYIPSQAKALISPSMYKLVIVNTCRDSS